MAGIGADTTVRDVIQLVGNSIFTGLGSTDSGNTGGGNGSSTGS
ncbi:hypothetical protein [Gordonia sp. (in: high G+C Gram-positive bacteria)]|jgi:hypothetical protein|nr:hypothetical protein [Gordonia sp. (in: high G+C Gram-positive bacteria)]HMS74061.1 hypothetical protein [Gordonia sp. (in: high G+C Gram-positive bacteria)]HQV19879.1 hypothetical protein [Gordonia sp. (in: high G+C Gram-positive bacteria)]